MAQVWGLRIRRGLRATGIGSEASSFGAKVEGLGSQGLGFRA